MTFNEWHVYARDQAGVRQGEIDDYLDLEMIPAFCDVGVWTMSLNADAQMAANLMQPGWGIVAVRDGVAIFSGPTDARTFTVDANTNQIELSGFDDNIWLKNRNVSPVPSTMGPSYAAQQSDNRSGVASTIIQQYVNVNLGPGAVTTRRLSGLTLAADPAVGSTVSGVGRWDNLLVFIQTLATSGNVGFRITQVGNGLVFSTSAPVDRSASVKFSIELGNLSKFEYSASRPTSNHVFVGGDGDSTSRTILELNDGQSVATWGRIEGDFVSASDTTDTVAMTQSANDALSAGSEQDSLNVTPIDTPNCMYGIHYGLGDIATVQLSKPIRTPYGLAGQVVATVQSVDIHLMEGGGGAVTTPNLGSSPKREIAGLFRSFRDIRKRLNNLERH